MYPFMSFLLAFIALSSSIAEADIPDCTLVIDTKEDMQSAGYRWDYLTMMTNTTTSNQEDTRLDIFTARKSDDASMALNIFAIVSRNASTSSPPIFINAQQAINLTASPEPISTAFRIQLILDSFFDKQAFNPNYLLSSPNSCQINAPLTVMGVAVFQLLKVA